MVKSKLNKNEVLISLLVFLAIIVFVLNIDLNKESLKLSPELERQEVLFVEGKLYVKFNLEASIYNEDYAKDKLNEILKNSQYPSPSNPILGAKKIFPNKNSEENIYEVYLEEGSDLDQALLIIQDSNLIDFVSKEAKTEPAAVIPNDYYFPWMWFHNNTGNNFTDNASGTNTTYYPGALKGADIDTPEAWEFTTGSSDVVIAFGDVKFELEHPDMAGKFWVNENEIPNNLVDDDNNGYVDDYYGYNTATRKGNHQDLDCVSTSDCHGAGVASWLANSNNGIGISGVCWGCKALAISAGGGISGIPFAIDSGADIFSLSWAGTSGASTFSQNLVNEAHEAGLVVFSAAGNDCTTGDYGCGINQSTYPAALDNVISIAGVDTHGNKFYTSSYYSAVDLAAPMAHLHTLNNVSLQPSNFYGYTVLWNKYGQGSGTSFAGPMAASVAGLVLSLNPNLTPEEVESILQTSAKPLPGGSTQYFVGNGMLNAYGALVLTNNSLKYGSFPVSLIDWNISQRDKILDIYGSASSPDFDNYILQYGVGNYPSTWTTFWNSSEQVNDNFLGQLIFVVPTINQTVSIKLITYDIYGQNATDHVARLVSQTLTDTITPIISNDNVHGITHDSASVNWNTNEPTSAILGYGNSSGVYTDFQIDNIYRTSHDFNISGLTHNTTYYLNITSFDTSGNQASKLLQFKTLEQQDSIAPSISNINVLPSQITILKDKINVSADVSDNTEVGEVILQINNSINYTMDLKTQSIIGQPILGPVLSGTYEVSVNSFDLYPGTFDYKIIAKDPSGNQNETETSTFTINPTCILTGAYWEPGETYTSGKELFPASVHVNDSIKIVLESLYCNNDAISIQIKEDDAFLVLEDFNSADPVNITIDDSIISSPNAEIGVNISWTEDYDSYGKDPEYIFRIIALDSAIQNMYIGSSNYLKITGGDFTSPEILDIKENQSTSAGSIIKSIEVTTNENVLSQISSGTSPDNLSNVTELKNNPNYQNRFNLIFSALDPPKDYYYKFEAADEGGNIVESQVNRFSIPHINDVSNPVINEVISYPNPVQTTEIINITANVTDDFGISQVILELNGLTNYTLKYSNGLYSTINANTKNLGVHNYKIIVFDTNSNRVETFNSFNVISQDTTPPQIINTLVTPTDTSAIISWTTNENATSGPIEYSETPGGPYLGLNAIPGFRETHIVEILGLNNDTTYYYIITSIDSSGNSANTSENSFTTLITPDTTNPVINSAIDNSPIGMEENLIISATATDNRGSLAKFNLELDGLTNYTMNYLGNDNYDFSILGSTIGLGTHSYKLIAEDASGNKDIFGPITFDVLDCVLTGVNWDQPNANEGQIVSFTINGNNCNNFFVNVQVFESDVLGQDPVSINPGTLTFSGNTAAGLWTAEFQQDCAGLCNPPEYYLEATTTSDIANSKGTSELEVFTLGTLPVVTLNSPVNEANLLQGNVNFDCSATSNNDIQSVEFNLDDSSSFSTYPETDNGSVKYTTSRNINTLGLHNWSCMFTDNLGQSSTSPAFSFTIHDPIPPVISNVRNTSVTDDSAGISWDTDEPTNSIVVYGTVQGNYPNNVSDLTSYVLNHGISLTSLSSNTTYYYRVISYNLVGLISQSQESNFRTLSAQDNQEDDEGGSSPLILKGGSPLIFKGSGDGDEEENQTVIPPQEEINEEETESNEQSNTIDLTNSVSLEKELELSSYILTIVSGISHDLVISSVDQNTVSINLDNNIITLPYNQNTELYLDGFRLIISYSGLSPTGAAKLTLTKEKLVEAQFNLISVLIIILILVSVSLGVLNYMLKKRAKYKNL